MAAGVGQPPNRRRLRGGRAGRRGHRSLAVTRKPDPFVRDANPGLVVASARHHPLQAGRRQAGRSADGPCHFPPLLRGGHQVRHPAGRCPAQAVAARRMETRASAAGEHRRLAATAGTCSGDHWRPCQDAESSVPGAAACRFHLGDLPFRQPEALASAEPGASGGGTSAVGSSVGLEASAAGPSARPAALPAPRVFHLPRGRPKAGRTPPASARAPRRQRPRRGARRNGATNATTW